VKLPKPVSKEAKALAPFAGVSEVDMAPVAIGNTLRSTQAKTLMKNGVVSVVGRDFVTEIGGIGGGITSWCLNGGFPLSPAALVASALRGYFASYQQYRFRRAVVHFITSSPTYTPGDILVLHHDNRGGPKVNHQSANFLSYALSTKAALLGPQWANHSMVVECASEWLNTDLLNSEDVQHQADGEILVYGRATTNVVSGVSNPDSPGFLVLDYVVDFRHMMVNPRVNSLPTALFRWFQTGVKTGSISPAAGDRVLFTAFDQSVTLNAGTGPAGDVGGNIYQVVFDFGRTPTNPNGLNLNTIFAIKQDDGGGLQVFPITNGTTLYLVSFGFPTCELYASYDAVFAGRPMVWLAPQTSVIVGFAIAISLVGSNNAALQQANIG